MITDDIKNFFKGEVEIDPKILDHFSEDASIFSIRPEVVVFPKDAADIKNLIQFITKNKKNNPQLSLSARSAGTDMTGGPLTESIVAVFTKHFNRIKEIGEDYVIAEPGVYYRDLEPEITKRGLIFPPYPASKELCAIGGIVSNNAAGEKTLAYGKTEDYVLELKVVLSDGNEYSMRPLDKPALEKKMEQKDFEGKIYKELFELIIKNQSLIQKAKPRVSKNSAGYYLWNVWDGKNFDIIKLLVGSQGTLGIVTEVKLKLVKIKLHSRMVTIFLRNLSPLGEVVNTVLTSQPESLEAYDDKTLWLAVKFLPDLIKALKKKYGSSIKALLQFLPDFWMTLTFGFPKLVLLAELTGDNEKQVIRNAVNLVEKIQSRGFRARMTRTEAEAEKYWTIRRESFNLLRQKVKRKHTAPFIDDVIVQPKYLPEFLPRLNALIDKYKEFTYTIAGHAGDGNFHIIPLMDFTSGEARASIPKLSDEVYDLVKEFNGSITAEHNDGLIRTPYLNKMYSPKVIKLFEAVKNIFDPQNIMNPKKKAYGDLSYALDHIKIK